jgi:hypothetical protein
MANRDGQAGFHDISLRVRIRILMVRAHRRSHALEVP